mmetsp:Transcript_14404/g.27391  ORF Transcript_14404/g.27391 Transcript_14404/m.27391 type:complete len:81 (+) Transcript_14404:67-309(+)
MEHTHGACRRYRAKKTGMLEAQQQTTIAKACHPLKADQGQPRGSASYGSTAQPLVLTLVKPRKHGNDRSYNKKGGGVLWS